MRVALPIFASLTMLALLPTAAPAGLNRTYMVPVYAPCLSSAEACSPPTLSSGYTFESVAPRKTRRLGQFKTLSKGVKNWVMSDDSSLDEALAEARSDEEREVTSHQLDAFHSTFNFCMTCRQYTCGNCWNVADGRCLSCAPNLGQEILPAPFPDQAAFELLGGDLALVVAARLGQGLVER